MDNKGKEQESSGSDNDNDSGTNDKKRISGESSGFLLVSDIHFGICSVDSLKALLQTLEENMYKVVIFSGDITQDSKEEEWKMASYFVEELIARGIKVIATPGNHDFGRKAFQQMSRLSSKLPGFATPLASEYNYARGRLELLFSHVLSQNSVLFSNEFDSITLINNDIVCALNSHHRKCPRIKSEQIEWLKKTLRSSQMKEKIKLHSSDIYPHQFRHHFLCHHSLWQDLGKHGDKHSAMQDGSVLEKEILIPFNFYSFIHGHNHRFTYGNTITPSRGFRIKRISVPTLSERNSKWERGFLVWKKVTSEPELIHLKDPEVKKTSDPDSSSSSESDSDSDEESTNRLKKDVTNYLLELKQKRKKRNPLQKKID